jgi:hypothetical protein
MYLPGSSFVSSTVGEDLPGKEPLQKCNPPGKGTNESRRYRLGSNEGLHVHTLPRQSVIMAPAKLVLNKTTNRAGWSVPQSRQARELQVAIFNELNEEVSRNRREQMAEAKRKETVQSLRSFRRQKHKRGKQGMVERHFFRTDRCSTCEFLDLEICVHDDYAYAKRYTIKNDAAKLVDRMIEERNGYFELQVQRSRTATRPSTVRGDERRRRSGQHDSHVSPRVKRGALRANRPATSSGIGRRGLQHDLHRTQIYQDSTSGRRLQLPVSPLAPQYDQTWIKICNSLEQEDQMSTEASGAENTKPPTTSPPTLSPLLAIHSFQHKNILKTPMALDDDSTFSLSQPVPNLDIAAMEDAHQITDSEAQWMQNTVENIGNFYSLDVYGSMKLQEARHVSEESSMPCRLVTDLSVILMEKILLSSCHHQRYKHQIQLLSAKVLYHLMLAIYEKNSTGFSFFSVYRNLFNHIRLVLQPSFERITRDTKNMVDQAGRIRKGMNNMVKRWQKPLLQGYFTDWRNLVQSIKRSDKLNALMSKVAAFAMQGMGRLAIDAMQNTRAEKAYERLLLKLTYREWHKFAIQSKLDGYNRLLDQQAHAERDAGQSLLSIKEEVQNKRRQLVVLMQELKSTYERIEAQRSFLEFAKWKLKTYDESMAIAVAQAFIKFAVPAYKSVLRLMHDRTRLSKFVNDQTAEVTRSHHGIFDDSSCVETILHALVDQHHKYDVAVRELENDFLDLVVCTHGSKVLDLMDLLFQKFLQVHEPFYLKNGAPPSMTMFADELDLLGQVIDDNEHCKTTTENLSKNVIIKSRLALSIFQTLAIESMICDENRIVGERKKLLERHLVSTLGFHVINEDIQDRVDRCVHLVKDAKTMKKSEYSAGSHQTIMKWGSLAREEMEAFVQPIRDYRATEEQMEIKEKMDLMLGAEADTWNSIGKFVTHVKSTEKAAKEENTVRVRTTDVHPADQPYLVWESFESHRMEIPPNHDELLASMHHILRIYLPALRAIYRHYCSGFCMKSQDFNTFVKDCRISAGAQTDLIFVKIAKSQCNIRGVSEFEKNPGQLGRAGFIEALVLLFLARFKPVGKQKEDLIELEENLHSFLKIAVIGQAKSVEYDLLASKMNNRRIERVVTEFHSPLATIFRYWAGSTWKGPPLKNWQKSMNVSEWMSFLKENGLLDGESGSAATRARERSKRVVARTAGASNVNAITELTEEDMQKNVEIRQVSQLSARTIFLNACGQGQYLDLDAVVKEAGEVKGRHNAERWSLLSFYDDLALRKTKGADDAETKKINRAETMDTRAFIEGLGALAEYQQPNPFTSLDEKLNDLLKNTLCTREALSKLPS